MSAALSEFRELMAGPERKEFRWETRVLEPRLDGLQRMLLIAWVKLNLKDFTRWPKEEFRLTAWLGDASGHWLPDAGLHIREKLEEIPLRDEEYEFRFSAVVRPGDYTFGLALCEGVGQRCNTLRKRVRVKPIKRDPLPEMWRDLPPAQFLDAAEDLDLWYRPELRGELWLPVKSRRRLEIELLVNFSTSERHSGSYRAHYVTVGRLLKRLRALAAIRPANGSVNITAVDVMRQRVLFEQRNVEKLDWPRLQEALDSIHPRMISLEALEERKENAAFFRQVLADRLYAGEPQGADGADPMKVIIVLSGAILFSRGTDLEPLRPEANCDCRVYHLQVEIDDWDELGKVMRRLKPRRFSVGRPEDFRRALAEVAAELGRM